MSYVDSHLLANEQVVYGARPHWASYVPSGLFIVIGLSLMAAVGSNGPDQGAVQEGFGAALFLLGILLFPIAWIKVKTSEFAATNKRVVIKVELIRRRSQELLLRQVEGTSIIQDIMGRILGYGVITVNGTGGT
jgi:uncharacterized membrane protein YdbT with pleckstrin-like domain